MDTTAGICLTPAASLLCVLNGGDPRVIARAPGYRDSDADAEHPGFQPPRPGGLRGLFGRLAGAHSAPEEDLSAFPFARAGVLLQELMEAAPADAPRPVCIAVPSYANDEQRHQVLAGAREAGWAVLGLVNEPIAAAMASGVLHVGDGTALVYDLAPFHFDVTLVSFRDTTFEELAADGLLQLDRGLDLTERLARTKIPCMSAMEEAGVTPDDLDCVVLAGALARQPEVVAFVEQLFGQPPLTRFDPEEIVGFGAAVRASMLELGQGAR